MKTLKLKHSLSFLPQIILLISQYHEWNIYLCGLFCLSKLLLWSQPNLLLLPWLKNSFIYTYILSACLLSHLMIQLFFQADLQIPKNLFLLQQFLIFFVLWISLVVWWSLWTPSQIAFKWIIKYMRLQKKKTIIPNY